MKRRGLTIILFSVFFVFSGCSTSEADFIGVWETDIFDQGDSREQASDAAKGAFGDFFGALASSLADALQWNAVMEIREDGTLSMDSGMTFTATWEFDGDKIIISGDNIAGTATLSDDKNTLYFSNTISTEETDQSTGIAIGSNSLDFEFYRNE